MIQVRLALLSLTHQLILLIPVAPISTGVLSGKTIKSIIPGLFNTVALGGDNLIYDWGAGTSGSLGNNSTAQSLSPVAVTTTGVLSGKTILKYAQHNYTTCVVASDNKAYCWGRGVEGQLGNGGTTASSVPVAVDTSGVLSGKTIVDIQVGGYGSVSTACALDSAGKLYCWGDNTYGQLCYGGGAGQSASPIAVQTTGILSGKTVSKFWMSSQQLMILTTDGILAGCGNNSNGQLGTGSSGSSVLSPTQISMTNLAGKTVKSYNVSRTASSYSCLITNDDLLYCWGSNTGGQTGLGLTSGNTLSPTRVNAGDLAGKTIKAIYPVAGGNYGCAIDNNSKVICWGSNFNYNLGNGNGTTTANTTPTQVASTENFVSLSANLGAVCGLTDKNQVFCWGSFQSNGVGYSTSGPTAISLGF